MGLNLPQGLTITDILTYSLQEQIRMKGTRKERRFILQNNLRELKKSFNKLPTDQKNQFIQETLSHAGR